MNIYLEAAKRVVRHDPELALIALCLVLAVLAAGWGVYLAAAESNEWSEFAAAHDCRIVGKESGSVGTGLTTSGKMAIITTPGKVGYECNDGVTYWRSE